MIHFPSKEEVDSNETKETLGDLIRQINDIETVFCVCSNCLSLVSNEAQS